MTVLSYDKEALIEGLTKKRDEMVAKSNAQAKELEAEGLVVLAKKVEEAKAQLGEARKGNWPQGGVWTDKGYAGRKTDVTSAYDQRIRRLRLCSDTVIKLNDKAADDILRLLS